MGLVRWTFEDGGSVLVESGQPAEGPVKAGRITDTVQQLPLTMEAALAPIRDTARAVLGRLREAGSTEVQVEFGVDLAIQTGAVIVRGEAGCHMKVTVTWKAAGGGSTAADTGA